MPDVSRGSLIAVTPEEQGGPGGQGERHECLHCTPSDDDPDHGTAAPRTDPSDADARMIDVPIRTSSVRDGTSLTPPVIVHGYRRAARGR